jgi:hypothetical protein
MSSGAAMAAVPGESDRWPAAPRPAARLRPVPDTRPAAEPPEQPAPGGPGQPPAGFGGGPPVDDDDGPSPEETGLAPRQATEVAQAAELTGPVEVTERAVIGDELRAPGVWCELTPCISHHIDPAALGEADVREHAVEAGWRYDALGRLTCPACQQTDTRFRGTQAVMRWERDAAITMAALMVAGVHECQRDTAAFAGRTAVIPVFPDAVIPPGSSPDPGPPPRGAWSPGQPP